MASHKHGVFKTPQKSTDTSEKCQGESPSVAPHQGQGPTRYRSPLATIHNQNVARAAPMYLGHHSHRTPPKTFFKVKNPFEKHLIDNLHTPICSPGMFKIRESESGSFKWDIEHMCILKPADIEPCNSQFDPSPDPLLEEKATKAIERFFSQEMIVPSPMEEAPKRNIFLPMDSKDDQTTPEGTKSAFRELWTQTALTFPVDLPPEIENTLKAFCTFSKEQIGVAEADLSANASLRRKLCFEEIYSDVEEEEVHMSVHNVSCPVSYSPQLNPLLKGFKRTIETPQSKSNKDGKEVMSTPGSGKRISDEELFGLSPIVKHEMKQRTSEENNIPLHSPSVSPIHDGTRETLSSFEKCDNAHHACETSPFSQSTPEKSNCTSKSSIKSSPETSFNSDVSLRHGRRVKNAKYFKFTDDMCNIVKSDFTNVGVRSKSEMSIASLGRSRSVVKLDFSMDVSSENSTHLSGSHYGNGGSEPNSPGEMTEDNCWDLELAQFVMSAKKSEEIKCNKCDANFGTVVSVCSDLVKENFCDCQSAIEERLNDVYQYLTPTKNKTNNVYEDLVNVDESSPRTYSSPMQTSPSNCASTNTDSVLQKMESFGSHFSMNYSRSLNEQSSSTFTSDSIFKNDFESVQGNSKKIPTFKIKDSGFNECLGVSNLSSIQHHDSTVCNITTKQGDSTKSFAASAEVSNVSWKRFDSGFNEETSSDFSHHISHSDVSKRLSKKYSPIIEYAEEKENIYFEECRNICEYNKPTAYEAMSVSEVFPEEMSFACSSTPSRNKFHKNSN